METEPFPGATFTPNPDYKPRDEKSRRYWMVWDKLTDLVSETLSTHPAKQEIINLRKKCGNVFYGTVGMSLDRDTEGELWQTVNELDTLLKHWKENSEDGQDTASLLRFYPAGSNKTARFNRYAI